MHDNFSLLTRPFLLIGKMFSDLQQVILVLLSRFLFFFFASFSFCCFCCSPFLMYFSTDFADSYCDFFHQNFLSWMSLCKLALFYSHMADTAPLSFGTLTFGTYTQSYISSPPFPCGKWFQTSPLNHSICCGQRKSCHLVGERQVYWLTPTWWII